MSEEYRHMIVNRFSSEPDSMFFYYSMGQNRIETRIPDPNDSTKTILYNEMPDFEIWSIFAKKNCPFISEVRKTYAYFTTTRFEDVEMKFIEEDIYMNRIDDSSDYLYLNMAVTYTLQRKQFEMDQKLSLFGKR